MWLKGRFWWPRARSVTDSWLKFEKRETHAETEITKKVSWNFCQIGCVTLLWDALLNAFPFVQSSGSGSVESICFWASRIRIHWSEIWIQIRILLSSSRNGKKNIDSNCFATLSLKNDVNVPSKSNKKTFVDVLKITDENSRIRIQIH